MQPFSASSLKLRSSLLAFLVLTPCLRAHAEPPLPVRVSYSGDAECPSSEAFREAVERRAPDLTAAGEGELAREFVVSVRRTAEAWQGNVQIADPSGAKATRQLEGSDCQEVSDALAFIVAELGRAVRLDDEPAPAPTISVAPPAPVPPPSAPPAVRDARVVHVAAGVGLLAVSEPTPDWAPGLAAWLDVGWAPGGKRTLASARLSLLRAASGTISGTIGDADLTWLSSRVDVCAPRLGSDAYWLAPCAGIDVGWIEASGSRALHATSKTAPWLAPGLSLRTGLMALKAFVLEAEATGLLPLSRPQLYFATTEGERETLHSVGNWGFRAGLNVGALFL